MNADPTTVSCAKQEDCQDDHLCPLSRVVAGSAVRIKQLSTPPDVSSRLREMGFCEDQDIHLVSRQSSLICLVCNARLGISSQLADNILVELLPPASAAAPASTPVG